MNKLKHLGLILNVICLAGIIYLVTKGEDKKTAFFMSAEVYNEFTFKQELETELADSYNRNQQKLDSLELDLQMTIKVYKQSDIDPTKEELVSLERKQNDYIQFRDIVENDYATKVQESYSMIWSRINEYVAEYGENNGYRFIFGANGDGSLMYADQAVNITEEIIAYVNQRYAGKV